MENESNRRRHIRLVRDDTLYVQILAASQSPELVGETIRCQAYDVSASGLRISVSQKIPTSSEMDLWIDVRSCASKFFLNGIVKWCYELCEQEVEYQMGIELLNLPMTDYDQWQLIFDGIENVSHFDQKK